MRLPTAGRIRIGVKGAEDAPRAIDHFRFTSHDRTALDQVAAIYGGEVKPWADPKAAPGQFEVITGASEIRVALPPDPLGGSPNYELWSGGGCARRCDGETCEIMVAAGDDVDLQEVPCICWANGARECKVVTRLSVILPEIRFVGTWRIDTKSEAAADELPGMVSLVQSLGPGLARAVLRIEPRRGTYGGKTRQFKVPVLGMDASVEELASGAARVGQLGTGSSVPALAAGSGETVRDEGPAVSPDDEIVDAEIVDEPTSLATLLPDGVPVAKALVFARKVSKDHGLPLPTTLEAVTDEGVISAVLDEVRS